jgi:hypothetical protein
VPKKVASPDPGATPAQGRPHFKRRELRLADGASFVLMADGTIDLVGSDGKTTQSWSPDDDDWPRQALRFGVHPQSVTVTPDGRHRSDMRPPRP